MRYPPILGFIPVPAYTSVGSRALPPAHGSPRQRASRHGDHGREKAWPRRGFEPLHTGVVCRCFTTEPPEALGAALPPYSKCSSVLRTEPPAFKLDTISIEIAAYLVLLEAVDLNSSLTMAGIFPISVFLCGRSVASDSMFCALERGMSWSSGSSLQPCTLVASTNECSWRFWRDE